ncbi:MAG: helix-hairpin-helix domain-containing protein [Prevotella sp.]|nr:helix-hairpin-helix domain-containing protein [Prevotella sp.]
MNRRLFVGLTMFLGSLALMAQEPLEEIVLADDVESENWQQNQEVLSQLSEQKINLNTATQQDLEQIPFLNDEQIQQILEFVYRYGPLRSWGELAMIESIDQPTRQLLMQVVYLGESAPAKAPSLSEMLQRGRHELLATARVPFYERRGDKNGYLGYPYRHSLRYTFHAGQQLKIAFVGAQDAGEPFFANRNKVGYDHYSFYLTRQGKGWLKNLTVGRYRLRLGLGLVVNNDFGFGKLATLSTVGRSFNTIRGHSSRMSANYLQGAAATFRAARNVEATAFLSYRKIDATLVGDSIRTILATGYHRTPTEMDHKNNASELMGGGRVNYRQNGFHLGATAVFNHFDKPLQPLTGQVYREIYPAGQTFWNIGADYGYKGHGLVLSGETATGGCKGIATLNSISYRPSGQLKMTALQRFYSYRYYALHSESFSEGGRVQNESGVLLGVQWQPYRYLLLTAYTDYVYFPWARYLMTSSSHAWDNLVSMNYERKNWRLSMRYRLRLREQDSSSAERQLQNRTEQRLRTIVGYQQERWSTKTQADVTFVSDEENHFGWMLMQAANYESGQWLLSGQLAYFHTKDYDSRIYCYERAPLYSFSFPMLYGEGLRYMLLTRWTISSHLQLTAKLATTNYFDRNSIGTGLQTIDHSSQTDLDLQLKWKF